MPYGADAPSKAVEVELSHEDRIDALEERIRRLDNRFIDLRDFVARLARKVGMDMPKEEL